MLLALCAATALSPARAEPVWLTIGDAAYQLLRRQASDLHTESSAAVAVQRPLSPRSSVLVAGSETVHVVRVDDSRLPALSEAVHEELRRCGGFVRHESQAEALAVLHRLQQPGLSAQAAPSYAINNQAQVGPLLPQLQASHILSTIESMAAFQNRISTSSHGVAASDWLYQQWRQLAAGRSDVQVQQVRHVGWPQKSVLLRITGRSKPAETIVLGGHLDSISSGSPETARAPGADDDASGVASLTEVIRVMMAGGYRPERSIEFIAYAAEEAGLRGSQQIATQYQRRGRQVLGVLQLDMTAYQGDAQDIWIFTDHTNAAQNQFVADLVTAYLPSLSVAYDRCGYACSDHASWTARGFASSFPFEASFAHSNPRIHTPNDTTANFGTQAAHALKFTQLALAFAVELGSEGAVGR
jgi:leucyl aminopeptidase